MNKMIVERNICRRDWESFSRIVGKGKVFGW